MKRAAARLIYVFVLMSGLCAGAGAQQADSETRLEFWPEVDIFVPLNRKVRVVGTAGITKAEETKERQEFQAGARVDYIEGDRWVLGFGYRYLYSPGDSPGREHRIFPEQTLRQSLPLKILLSDRNREEFRIINGDYSFRYRNRLTIEREFRLLGRSLTPYGSVEAFHDSRFGVWSRTRFTVGAQIQMKRGAPVLKLINPRRRLVLEPYFTYQHDSRSEPHKVNALGLTFSIYL